MRTQKCPRCGSDEVLVPDGTLEAVACGNCTQLFVPENREQPETQMCDDCAFRPNSPERQDEYKWADIIDTTIVNEIHPFYCHKGMACKLSGNTLTYQMPEEGEAAMTPCAGWRAHKAAYKAGIPARKL